MKIQTSTNPDYDIVINAAADIFVVPNRVSTLSGFCCKSVQNRIKNFGKINGIEVDEYDRVVEIWAVCKELGSENLVDHGINIDTNALKDMIPLPEDSRMHISLNQGSLVPFELIKDLHEDETVKLVWEATGMVLRDESSRKYRIRLELDCKASQLKYRYRRFGTFDSTLAGVLY